MKGLDLYACARLALIVVAVVVMIVTVVNALEQTPDVIRDKATGCQYLGYKGGGITPRRMADGTQLCTLPEQDGGDL